MSSKQVKIDFVNKSYKQLFQDAKFLCGFELEYQKIKSNAKKKKNAVNLIGITEATNQVNRQCPCEHRREAFDESFMNNVLLRNAVSCTVEITPEMLEVLPAGMSAEAVISQLTAARTQAITNLAMQPIPEARRSRETYSASHLSNVEYGSDGSVDGGEIRTKGGLAPKEFAKSLRTVLKDDITVDHGCSFHIHVSVEGVTHKFSTKFQGEVTAFLLHNFDKLPKYVQARLFTDKRKWAKFQLSTDKYSAVHYHDRFNTWEFRLFGSVDTVKDGMTCLKIAVNAIKHAYAVELGEATSLVKDMVASQMQDAFDLFTGTAVVNGETVSYEEDDEDNDRDRDYPRAHSPSMDRTWIQCYNNVMGIAEETAA